MTVQMLRLLQEDVVEHSGDVDSDVILYWLKNSHVGADAGQQLTGLGYLLSGLVVHGHPYYGPGIREFPLTSAALLETAMMQRLKMLVKCHFHKATADDDSQAITGKDEW